MYIYFKRNAAYLSKILPITQNSATYTTERKYGCLIVSVDNISGDTKYNVASFDEVNELDKYDEFMVDLAVALGAKFVGKDE